MKKKVCNVNNKFWFTIFPYFSFFLNKMDWLNHKLHLIIRIVNQYFNAVIIFKRFALSSQKSFTRFNCFYIFVVVFSPSFALNALNTHSVQNKSKQLTNFIFCASNIIKLRCLFIQLLFFQCVSSTFQIDSNAWNSCFMKWLDTN